MPFIGCLFSSIFLLWFLRVLLSKILLTFLIIIYIFLLVNKIYDNFYYNKLTLVEIFYLIFRNIKDRDGKNKNFKARKGH